MSAKRVFAPGKLVLTGAYAVLHGAPAVVVATSRGAVADGSKTGPGTLEVQKALGDAPAPYVDASALFWGDRKLGLGASSAILVASLGVCALDEGRDLTNDDVRADLFRRAWKAHAEAQGGGSGVDIAASVYGGALRYRRGEVPERIVLSCKLHLSVFACSTSARTSELRAALARFEEREPTAYDALMSELRAVAEDAARSAEHDDPRAFIGDVRRTADVLTRLGKASGTNIVPSEIEELAALAAHEDAAFCVSGAGGGDVVVFFGAAAPSDSFVTRARALGLGPLDLAIDERGVRVASSSSVRAEEGVRAGAP